MSTGNQAAEEVLDLGSRLFLASVFIALGLASLVTIVGYGLTGNGFLVTWGIVNIVLAMLWADWAYTGKVPWAVLLWVWLAAGVIIAGLAVVRGTPGAFFLAALVFVPGILAAAAYCAKSARIFLAAKAGAPIEHLVSSLNAGVGPGVPAFVFQQEGGLLTLAAETRQQVESLSRLVRLGAALLLALAAVDLFAGVWLLVQRGQGLALFPLGIVAALAGLVMLTFGDDLFFLAATKGYEKNHLTNSVASAKLLSLVGAVLGVLVLLLLGALAS